VNIKEVHRVVSAMKSTLFKKANSHSAGILKSNFRGSGLQFKDYQVYNYGDDPRFIDWKVYAKSNRPYIKLFEEERNVEIVILLDASPTMFSGYNGIPKIQAAVELCSLLYLIAKDTGDYVKIVLFSNQIHDLPKSQGEKGIYMLIDLLERIGIYKENGKINLEFDFDSKLTNDEKMNYCYRALKKKKEVIIFSDFQNFLGLNNLRKVTVSKNVHSFRIISPLDEYSRVPYVIPMKNIVNPHNLTRGEQLSLNKEASKLFHIKDINVAERYLEDFVKKMY